MNIDQIQSVLESVYSADMPNRTDLEFLLSLEDESAISMLFDYADKIRKIFVGDEILLRGLIEFSNYCRNTCSYCGLNKFNKKLERYRLDTERIMSAAKDVVAAGIKTVVLQSGEDDELDSYWLKNLIEQIKSD